MKKFIEIDRNIRKRGTQIVAIKIIKHGKETFKVVCPICGCEFSYQAEDLKEDRFHNHYVECPDCKQRVSHEYESKNKVLLWQNIHQ